MSLVRRTSLLASVAARLAAVSGRATRDRPAGAELAGVAEPDGPREPIAIELRPIEGRRHATGLGR